MDIPDIGGVAQMPGQTGLQQEGPKASQFFQDFSQALDEAVQEVDTKLKASGEAKRDVAAGGETSLHEAMIAGQKASLSLRLALQIRNKAMDAYKEIMRMQV